MDAAGDAYVTGDTQSIDFPIAGAVQPDRPGGGFDAFVTELSPDGTSLVYSTYLGGTDQDLGRAIAVDCGRRRLRHGRHALPRLPDHARRLRSVLEQRSGNADAFVTKLAPSGSALAYSTYLGGNRFDVGNGIAVDSAGAAFVIGDASSDDFPTVNPIQAESGQGQDLFVTAVDPAGAALVYSTYLGGSDSDYGSGIALDGAGNAYITGYSLSSNFPRS